MMYVVCARVSRKIGYPVPDLEPVGHDEFETGTGAAGIGSGPKSEDPTASGSNTGK